MQFNSFVVYHVILHNGLFNSVKFQDYKVHRDEIHTKLVQIMRERLLVHLRGLPQIVESWNRPEDNDIQPSQFARSLTKVHLCL